MQQKQNLPMQTSLPTLGKRWNILQWVCCQLPQSRVAWKSLLIIQAWAVHNEHMPCSLLQAAEERHRPLRLTGCWLARHWCRLRRRRRGSCCGHSSLGSCSAA